jgi:purine nucleosidase
LVAEPLRHFPDQAAVLETIDRVFVPPADGVDFLRAVIRQNPAELTVVTLGMLTNVALAFRIEPGLTRLVKKVVMMAGAMGLPYAETNARRDPEAIHIVVSSPAPFTLVTKDITQHAVMPEGDVGAIAHPRKPLVSIALAVDDALAAQHGRCVARLKRPPCCRHRSLPRFAETERVRVEVELRGEQTKGCTVITADPTGNGEVVKSVDWQRFWALMEQALFSTEA